MRTFDLLRFAYQVIVRHRTRSSLLLTAMAIGVAAVIALTALGEGARSYISTEFSELGSNLLIVLPGRNETRGGHPPVLGETPRDLTIDDALALTRSRLIRRIAPLVIGQSTVSFGRRGRDLTIVGGTHEFLPIRKLTLAQGRFLPALDPHLASPVCVLGQQARAELFGSKPALGQWLRISDRRFRVIGILASQGQSIGVDIDEMVVVPLASAQQLFDTASLFRILVEVSQHADTARAEQFVHTTIRSRHEGEDDVTVITQDALLATFDKIFRALTLAVAGIAAISLVVAAILIMNVTLVSVSQRTREIGLLKALGATSAMIRVLFMTEAIILALCGAAIGLTVAGLGIWAGRLWYPVFPLAAPVWAVIAAVGVALTTSLLFALLPARRASRLDPVLALAGR